MHIEKKGNIEPICIMTTFLLIYTEKTAKSKCLDDVMFPGENSHNDIMCRCYEQECVLLNHGDSK